MAGPSFVVQFVDTGLSEEQRTTVEEAIRDAAQRVVAELDLPVEEITGGEEIWPIQFEPGVMQGMFFRPGDRRR